MSNEVYAGGNKNAAVSLMKTRFATFFVVNGLGQKVLDTAKMDQWLIAQMTAVSGNGRPFDPGDASRFSAELAQATSPERMATMPGWPGDGPAPSSVATTVSTLQGQTRALSEAVTAHWSWLKQNSDTAKLTGLVQDFLDAKEAFSEVDKGVTRILDDRFYIATYVTDWDEESAPSTPSEYIQVDQNDTVTVTIPPPPGGRPEIVGWRLYRSNVGSVGAAFQLVEDRDATNAVLDAAGDFRFFNISSRTYVDDRRASQLQEPCPSLMWAPPPTNLRGLIGMPNGVLAGFYDNTVCFSESYVPYGWPVEYQITTEFPIVGLGVFGQTLVVCHQGGVDYISGADAASMSAQKNVSHQACASARSIVSAEGAVIFASPDGLCGASSAGVQLLTAAHYTREDWQKLVPSSIVGAYHESSYFFTTAIGCHALHAQSGKLTTVSVGASAFFTDRLTDQLYAVEGTSISAIFGSPFLYRTGVWKSKKFVTPRQESMAWIAVQSDYTYPITVRWYGDGTLRHTVTLNENRPYRLPAGRYLEHEIEVSSNGRWNVLTLASTTDELKQA